MNDEYGHSVGDQVLIEVTEKCKDNLRYHDIVARLGGEEFCILLPYTNAIQAEGIAERLRGKIESMQIISEGYRINVTVSVGLSLVCSDDFDGHDAMQRADHKLLEAKTNGQPSLRLNYFRRTGDLPIGNQNFARGTIRAWCLT